MKNRLFSNVWKKQGCAKEDFPTNGKVFFEFSNEWKKVFHSVENFWRGA